MCNVVKMSPKKNLVTVTIALVLLAQMEEGTLELCST